MIKRFIAAAAVACAGLIGLAVGPAAHASTSACTTGTYAGYCGTQTDSGVPGLSFDVYRQHAVSGNKIIGYQNSDTDPATDFYIFAYQGGETKIFEYAPHGVASNLCISEPSQQAGLVLRACNGSGFQRFVAVAVSDSQFTGARFTWRNAAMGDDITSNGSGGQLTGNLPVGDGGVVPATQQWMFSG